MMAVPVFQYYALDKAYIGFMQKFMGRLLLKFDASYGHYAYGRNVRYPYLETVETVTDPDTAAVTTTTTVQRSLDREDHVVRVEPTISYNILSWLGIALQYTFETRQTPYYSEQHIVTATNDTTTRIYYDYFDHRIMLTLAADY